MLRVYWMFESFIWGLYAGFVAKKLLRTGGFITSKPSLNIKTSFIVGFHRLQLPSSQSITESIS